MTEHAAAERSGFLERGGNRLAWRAVDGAGPTVVWLGGYRSDMTGTKAQALADAAVGGGWSYLRFDYSAHGESSGVWEDATIGQWRADALAVIDELTTGPLVLVGSSMGGWMACLAALDRPERLHAMVLIAPAPDFTDMLMRDEFPEEAKAQLESEGVWYEPNPYGEPYAITKRFLDEGADHAILKGSVSMRCPVRILQGQRDVDVPWRHALLLADQIESEDVVFQMAKAGDHRLSTPADIERLVQAVAGVRG